MLELDSAALESPVYIAPISDQLQCSELISIVGPNGAGKSTLISLLSGFRTPSSGAILLDGQALASFSPVQLARKRALVAQAELPSFDWQVDEFLSLGVRSGVSIARVVTALELEPFIARGMHSLSGGERQRVMIGRALCQLGALERDHLPQGGNQEVETRMLLLDEPSSALDIGHQQRLMRLLHQLAHEYGLTVVCVLHDLNLAITYSDRVWLMQNGERVAARAPHEMLDHQLLTSVFDVELFIEENNYIRLVR